MNRYRSAGFGIASCAFGLFAAVPAQAASVTQVSRSTWGATGVPSYVNMYIYVPDNLADKPPIVVACHSCGTPVSGYQNSITGIRSAADSRGFIIILPEATGRNCWDVGTMQSLTHDGGGDTQAIVQMVDYVLGQYDGDASRVYVMGGSSGAMMTQALLATYPDVFRAGSARAGVPAGCWADGFDSGQQWSNNCAGGRTTKSAQQWGDQARAMYPGYMGHRPRIQIFHGTNDTTIAYPNYAEAIKQWTNVLDLPTMPDSTDTKMTSVATYDRQFWKDECGTTRFEAWAGRNGTHSMAYEEADILAFFGLDQDNATDPEPDCPAGSGGAGGMGGTSGAGGAAGAAGTAGTGQAGMGGQNAGGSGPAGAGGMGMPGGNGGSAGSIGVAGSGVTGGIGGAGGTQGGGGSGGTGFGGVGTGGATGGGGVTGVSGSSTSGGSGGVQSGGRAGSATAGTAPKAGTRGDDGDGRDDSGGCAVAGSTSKSGFSALLALGIALLAFRRRQRPSA
ncbi:MAG TPA: PHB depolymerase family esterase [Polyangiaceae bacterium]